jgi:hypothetical protein
MTELERHVPVITDEQRQTFVGAYLLKKMDLRPEDGGMVMPVVLPSELAPLDEFLQELAVAELIEIKRRGERYALTPKGVAYIGALIDEAAQLVDELDELELDEAIAELRKRRLDLLRARFLWGWYSGELDDLVLFQERRGVVPVERLWAFYLVSDDFYRELARDTEA